jgi:hypothetical protein
MNQTEKQPHGFSVPMPVWPESPGRRELRARAQG